MDNRGCGAVGQILSIKCGVRGVLCPLCKQKAEHFDKIENWLLRFINNAKNNIGAKGLQAYYADAASGLAIALQQIDKQRYDARSPGYN